MLVYQRVNIESNNCGHFCTPWSCPGSCCHLSSSHGRLARRGGRGRGRSEGADMLDLGILEYPRISLGIPEILEMDHNNPNTWNWKVDKNSIVSLFVLHFIFFIYIYIHENGWGLPKLPAFFLENNPRTIVLSGPWYWYQWQRLANEENIHCSRDPRTQCIPQIYSGWMIMIKSSKKTYCSWNRLSDMIVFAWHPGTLKGKQKIWKTWTCWIICGFFHPYSNNGSVETGYFQDESFRPCWQVSEAWAIFHW